MSLIAKSASLTDSVRAYYDKLFQDGFLVSVHVSKWSMSTCLSQEDIEYDGKLPNIFKLGKKMLIDPERFNAFSRIESKARRFLAANSYDFPIGEAHFVPKKKVVEVLTMLDKIRVEYETLRANFIENYGTYKMETLAKYPDLHDSLEPLYPPKDSMEERFKYQVSIYEIQMPKELGAVDIQTLIDRDSAKEEVKAQLEAQLAGHYKTAMNKLETFTEQAAIVLRGQMVDMCRSVITKIEKKEVVTKASIQSIRDDIVNFRKLNFMDDQVVNAELDKLSAIVTQNINYKTDKVALDELNNVLVGVLEKANNLEDIISIPDTYFRRAIKI